MTVYVEGEKAARELGVRQRGGFFDDNRCVSSLPITPERHAHISTCSACRGKATKCLPGHFQMLWHTLPKCMPSDRYTNSLMPGGGRTGRALGEFTRIYLAGNML